MNYNDTAAANPQIMGYPTWSRTQFEQRLRTNWLSCTRPHPATSQAAKEAPPVSNSLGEGDHRF